MPFKKRQPTSTRRPRIPQQTARSGAVFSYHANRSVREGGFARDAGKNQQQADTAKRNTKSVWIKRLPTIGALLAILVVTVFCLQLSSNVKIVTLGTSESHVFLRDPEAYRQAAIRAFTPFFNGNKLTVNAQKISADLRKQFPELQAVSISLPVIGNQPVVYIQPTIPELILVSSQGMFLLDSNGRALISGNQVANLNEIDTPVVTDQSSLPLQVGQIALPRSTVAFVREVFEQLKAKGARASSLVLPPGTSELHVRLEGAGYYTRYNLHGNAREEVGAFLAVKARLDSERKTPREYIDVRVENKVYYK